MQAATWVEVISKDNLDYQYHINHFHNAHSYIIFCKTLNILCSMNFLLNERTLFTAMKAQTPLLDPRTWRLSLAASVHTWWRSVLGSSLESNTWNSLQMKVRSQEDSGTQSPGWCFLSSFIMHKGEICWILFDKCVFTSSYMLLLCVVISVAQSLLFLIVKETIFFVASN